MNLRPSAPKALFKKIEHLVYRSLLCFEELARAINWLGNTICWPYVGEYWTIYFVKVNDF
ncbi:hypothetical protein [Prochlorococcus marinus]|uniref:hypothetical protein n=1 Tax=Prochlorococcus marinus TaxID=1219 RepID=UPI001ADBF286|nr:hypothetical protein [Prochlorococcus marinus]MBO8217524.1 hypothetical protein [Prochlorococcus marinus XMU1405]